jgi:hypothetical protein
MNTPTQNQLLKIGGALGVAYGIFARFVFGLNKSGSTGFAVMTLNFIVGMPLVLGFLTVWFGEYRQKFGWARRVFMPWAASSLFLICCLALAWEGVICVVLLLPVMLILSSIGGLFAGLIRPLFKTDRSRIYCVTVLALLPFVAAPIENLRAAASEIRVVRTQIDIRADKATVWRQIRSVPLIREEEHFFNVSHLMGFPRPLEARLEGEGVGAIRYATFEKGVLFVETVTTWQEGDRLAFSIHADTKHIPSTTFDEHVQIGGPYFDVLEGEYQIEELGPGLVRLHLSSNQRLSTQFNSYAHLWTEYLMGDLQNYILKIVRNRCEITGESKPHPI